MKKYYRFILYSISGFLFITVYLICVMLTKKKMDGHFNKKLIKSKVTEKIEENYMPELTEAETVRILREVESTNNNRIQRVEEICTKYNLGLFKTSENKTLEYPPVPHYSVFYFDRKHRLSFCPIYKAGSSTWLFNLLLLAGMTEEEINNSKKQLSDMARAHYPELDPNAAEEAFLRTIKILTVRHPFERILSAYRDKLENTNIGREHGTLHFYNSFGSKIVKKYRKGGNETKVWDLLEKSQYLWDPHKPKPAGIEPTFREFVLFLIKSNLVHQSDDHWIPYYLFCTPCLLRYDIIAKVETMDLDQMYSIHVLGLQNKIKPRWRHKTQFLQDNSVEDSVSFVSRFYFRQLSVKEINDLYEKYKVDFDLFGYDHTDYLKFAHDFSHD